MKPLISVIIPVYNVCEYLPKCVDGVLHQTYENIEVLLIDDGSTDGCARLCDVYAERDGRVRVFHKTNGGLSEARNYGVERARGEYITFIDSDDYVKRDYVEYLFGLIDGLGTSLSVCRHFVVRGKRKTKVPVRTQEVLTDKTFIERMLYRDLDTSAWAKLYARSLFKGVRFPEGKLYEDVATVYKLALNAKSVAVGYEAKYAYVMRARSIVNCPYNERKRELVEMTDRMAEDVARLFPNLVSAVRCRRVYARISTLNQMIGAQGTEEAQREMADFVRHNADVARDKKAKLSDRIAVRLICKSLPTYRSVWRIYKKLFKG